MICISPGYDLRGFQGAKCPESISGPFLGTSMEWWGGGRGVNVGSGIHSEIGHSIDLGPFRVS